MDPQQKQLLQCVYRALENAGIPMEKASGTRTGVFFGTWLMNRDYETNAAHVHPSVINHWTGTGLAMSIAANRVSYIFNFTGPSLSIDCACSSSLVALHLACQAIRQGDCEMAVCGGVNCIIEPRVFVALSKAKMISPEGTSKPFSNRADGYGRGEGCGVVLLKPLKKAIQDHDNIWGIVSKTAVNQDGRSVTPITKPSMTQQEELLRRMYSKSDLANVQYIEAHGTGTPVGDPTEAGSISNAIAKARPPGSEALRIGSVKSNIGHTESAAGVAGLIKVLLMMKHETIVPSVFYSEDSASVDAKALNIKVPKEAERWEASSARIAGVNNFGFGGTNAHAIVKQHKQSRVEQNNGGKRENYFVMSANSPKSLTLMMEDTIKQLEADSKVDLDALLYTSACRRSHLKHKYRKAIVVSSVVDLKEKLSAAVGKNIRPSYSDPSHMMDPILPEIEETIGSLQVNDLDTVLFSTVTGKEVQQGDFCTGKYWARNIREPVVFEQAVRSSTKGKKNTVFVEIGPRRALQRNIMETLGNDTAVLASVQPEKDHETMKSVVPKLFELGLHLNWNTFYKGCETVPLPIPRYQFDCSDRDVIIGAAQKNTASNHPVLCKTGSESNVFSCDLLSDSSFYLREHKHNNIPIIPGAFYAELGLAAFMASAKPKDIAALAEVLTSHPCNMYPELVVKDGLILKPSIVRTQAEIIDSSEGSFTSLTSEPCILQTAEAHKMTQLSAILLEEEAQPIRGTSVEIQPTKICVHSSDYFPVSASHLKFGQTLYWNKHSSQKHKLLALDFSGTVTAVGKDVRKLKVGDHIASCYPVTATSKVRVPEDVCYSTKRKFALQSFPFENVKRESIETLDSETQPSYFNSKKLAVVALEKDVSHALSHIPLLPTKKQLFRKRAVYIVAGGLSGLGFETVKFISQRGGEYVIILSRSKPTQDVQQEISNVEIQCGNYITAMECDISVSESVHEAISVIAQKCPGCPIRGVFHSAVVLHDGLIETLDRSLYEKVFKPKVTASCYH
ncbi:Lovastatin nonaketide synthase [Liparis tanakae]|uniref:Lovastatin nonaketide synthase n=1 Tax=Liparis tanakae TaxID=230148 RepID=A0A4Z2FHG4_9TELE|nr:Lovastatin nonaketide synthase [Liparis tanakae]